MAVVDATTRCPGCGDHREICQASRMANTRDHAPCGKGGWATRLISPDSDGSGGSMAAYAVFIDHELAEPYGTSASNGMPAILSGTKE